MLQTDSALSLQVEIWCNFTDFNRHRTADSSSPASPPLPNSYEPCPQNPQTHEIKTWIIQTHINLRVLVFVYIVLITQLMKARKLLKTEILHRFGGANNIIITWIKLLTVQPLVPCSRNKWKWSKDNRVCFPCLLMMVLCWLADDMLCWEDTWAWAWDGGLPTLPCPSVTERRGQGSRWGHCRSSAIPWVNTKSKGGWARRWRSKPAGWQSCQQIGHSSWWLSALDAYPLRDSLARSVWLCLGCTPHQSPLTICSGLDLMISFLFYSKFKCTNVFYLYMTTSALQTQRNFYFLWSCKRNIHSGQHEAKKAPSQTIIYHNRTAWCWMRIIKFSVGSLKCHFHNQQLDSFATRDTNPPAATSVALWAEPFFPDCQPSTPNSSTRFSLPDFHLSSQSLRYFGEHHPFFLLKYLR